MIPPAGCGSRVVPPTCSPSRIVCDLGSRFGSSVNMPAKGSGWETSSTGFISHGASSSAGSPGSSAGPPRPRSSALQLDRVKPALLAETDLPLKQIASKTGFQYPEYISAAFKERTGQTPGEFRRSSQRIT